MSERNHGGVGGVGSEPVSSMAIGTGKPQSAQDVQRDTILVDVVRRLDVTQNRLHSALMRITDFRNRVCPEEAPRDEEQQASDKKPGDSLTGAIYYRLDQLHVLLDRAEQLAGDCERIG